MKLIDKDAVVAKIERMIKHYNESAKEFGDEGYNDNVLMEQCKANACEHILSFLDTIEVKEVDLERLVNDYFTGWYFDSELDILAKPNNYSATVGDVKKIAKHFFELGMASQPTTSVYGIEEALKENGIDPDSKEADIYREAIYKIYDRLQAQKGEGV